MHLDPFAWLPLFLPNACNSLGLPWGRVAGRCPLVKFITLGGSESKHSLRDYQCPQHGILAPFSKPPFSKPPSKLRSNIIQHSERRHTERRHTTRHNLQDTTRDTHSQHDHAFLCHLHAHHRNYRRPTMRRHTTRRNLWLSRVKYGDCNTTLRFELVDILEYSGPYLSRGEIRIEKFKFSLLLCLNHVCFCVQFNTSLYSE